MNKKLKRLLAAALCLLAGQGFTEAELKKIAARIAQATGATIIFC